MVSACAYSGAYPTGYGRYSKSTEGVPEEIFDRLQASGFTHFQQSGTGAIRKYYNYVRVTPMVQPLDALGDAWELQDEMASAGYYAATLDNGIRCEITVGEKVAVHRYTFPEHRSARVVVDLSSGGLAIPHGRTVPLRAQLENLGRGRAQGDGRARGRAAVGAPGGPTPGLAADALARPPARSRAAPSWPSTASGPPPCARSACSSWARRGPGQTVEMRLGFSLRGCEQARDNLRRECPDDEPASSGSGRGPRSAGPTTSTACTSTAAPRHAAR